MIGTRIKNFSIETRKQIIIHDLFLLGIHQGPNGEDLNKLDYYSLRSLLALKQAVES